MTDQSIIEKIKKLFALANRKTNNDGSSNEAEANAAMESAQRLLAKYNLDLHAVTDSSAPKPSAPVSGPREKVRINRSAMYRWQREFWRALAEANMCWHWVTEIREEHPRRKGKYRTVKRHVVLGSAVNVAAVTAMGEYLTEVMERDLPYPNSERLSNSALSWREGMAERLMERVTARMTNMAAEGFTAENGTACTGLAIRNMAEVEHAANYEARHGEGSWARHKQWEVDYAAGEEARMARWDRVAQEAINKREAKLAAMTPKEREKYAAAEEKKREREWKQYERQQQKEAERLDTAAYEAGRRKANTVNLDSQLNDRK